MNKLIVHLGTPKTGTTAIQFFLHDNAKRLMELNYDFPDVKEVFTEDRGFFNIDNNESSYANGNFIIDTLALSAYKEGRESFEELLKHVFPDIAEYYRTVIPDNKTDFDMFIAYIKERLSKHNVIISSENLWTFSYDFLKKLKAEIEEEIEVVVYLRRQDKYVESMWNEVIKLGVVSDTVQEYFDYMIYDEADNHGIHYGRRLKQLIGIVGRENVKVRLYEKESFSKNGGLCFDFLDAIGINDDRENWSERKIDPNGRIAGSTVNLKRIFNEYLSKRVDNDKDIILNKRLDHVREYNEIFYRLSSVYSKKNRPADAYFSAKERLRLEKLFSADNEYIAKEFFGRETGEALFANDNWSAERNVEPLSINEEAILRLLFEMCYDK
ncbi:MAG: hypothetical protein K6F00_05250 [Lachnospiraceae bacterium]|nr:hypothetical protein [Lachnospiraceae bacterium]